MLLLICLFASVVALAVTRITGTYVSACGDSWSFVVNNSTAAGAAQDLESLMGKMDAACGSSTTQIIQ